MSYYEHCKNCENFYQHYVIADGVISNTCAGHCRIYKLHLKNTRGNCEKFVERKKKQPNLKKFNNLEIELIKVAKNMSKVYSLKKLSK